MLQKCDGVKILDLEEKLEATGGEYIVTAEKDNNYKLPLESVADIVIGNSKFKAAIKDVYESSTPTASVSLDKDKFLFSFGIPAGRTGDAGKDGKDGKDGQDGKDGKDGIDGVPGIDGDTTRVVIAYKSTKTIQRPDTPVGGSWDYDTNTITYPEGWSLDVPELTNEDEYNYIWFIQVRIIDDQLESGHYWSKPNPIGGIITPDPVGSQPIAYPAGIYSVSTPYINDGEKAPYVYDTSDGNYYFLKSVMTWIGTQQNNESPATDTSSAWTKLEGYEAIYTDLLIAPNSLVGGAVFNNNLMFSQRGKNASGSDSSDYHLIDSSSPENAMNPSNQFRPNFLLDFKTGEAYFGAGGVHLAADSENSALELTSSDTKLTLDKSGLSMINNVSGGALSTSGTYIKKNNISQLTNDYQFKLDSTGIHMGQAQPPFTEWFGLNSDGSGSLAKKAIQWNTDGEITIGGNSDKKIVLVQTDFTGIKIIQTSNPKQPAVNIYCADSGGYIQIRSSIDGSGAAIYGAGDMYMNKIQDGISYGVDIDPTRGIIFDRAGTTTKTYTNW